MASSGVDRIQGVDPAVAYKAPCEVATTANITLEGAQTIDGIAVAETTPATRVLVLNQTDQTENGIYDVKGTAWTRSLDFNGNRDVVQGTRVAVINGTVGENKVYRVETDDPIVIGTSNITFGETDEAPSLTGYSATTNTYRRDDCGNTVGLDISSAITETNFESIGPTGSGADNIFSQMDVFPPDAKAIIIRVTANTATNSTNDSTGLLVSARKTGSSAGASVANGVLRINYDRDTNDTDPMERDTSVETTIPLDSNLRFDMSWDGTNLTSASIFIYILGFMT